MRIKSFNEFNEDLEVYATKMPYGKSLFITPMKDVDLDKKDAEGSVLAPKVPQFDPVKTMAIMLEDGNLVNQAAEMFPNTDLSAAMKNPNMLDDSEMEKLQFVYNEIILKDYVLRQKYDMLPDVKESLNDFKINQELKRRAMARQEEKKSELDSIQLSDEEIKEILSKIKIKKYDMMANFPKMKKLQKLGYVKNPTQIQSASSFSQPFYLTDKGKKLIE
jgi:hypothetical protein